MQPICACSRTTMNVVVLREELCRIWMHYIGDGADKHIGLQTSLSPNADRRKIRGKAQRQWQSWRNRNLEEGVRRDTWIGSSFLTSYPEPLSLFQSALHRQGRLRFVPGKTGKISSKKPGLPSRGWTRYSCR